MRVTFAGTPEFAACALEAIIAAGHEVPLVLTQPDRPAGRNQRPTPSAVKLAASSRGLAVYQPGRLKSIEQQGPVLAVPSEVMVVVAYGLILPPAILSHPVHGCLNIHASLLPRWRGAAPIQRAILAGDRETGISIVQMDAGLDTGPVISAHPVAIGSSDTAGSLHAKLADSGAAAIVAALDVLARDARLVATPQPDKGITYAAKIDKSEATIDWEANSALIERQVRAFNPAPGASTSIDGATLKIWSAKVVAWPARSADATGSVRISNGAVVVKCGGGSGLELVEVQPASGRRMRAMDYANRWTKREVLRLGT